MNHYLAVSPGKTVLRPLAKNILRAAALVEAIPVQFSFSGRAGIALSTGEPYPRGTQLLSALEGLAPHEPIPPAVSAALDDLRQWLDDGPGQKSFGPSFPLLLEEVRRQSVFSTCGNPQEPFMAFWEQWRRYYPLPQTFEIRGKSTINEVNQQEAGDYLQAHNQTAQGEPSIDRAARSLVSSLPADVERILDIGSGPGYGNRQIPADYAVLAMDIEEEILRGNVRQTCVGDIMDIPMADGSVDLVMACDVLEHLPDPVLKKGIAELMRVSRKYIYLQVPFQEPSLMAMALCSRCGHVWHINHHKRRYTQQELTALLPESWKPVCVNYTGDITTLRTGVHETEFADFFGFDIHSVEGMVCPKCGGKSILRGTDELELLHRMAGFDAEFPFPTYSEIGILFCRADQEAQLPDTMYPEQKPEQRLRNALRPMERRQALHVYTKAELLPELYTAGCEMTADEHGYHFRRCETAETAWVAISFPPLPGTYTGVEIRGSLPDGEGTVSVARADQRGQEQYLMDWQWSTAEATDCLNQEITCSSVYIKLYFSAPQLDLYSAGLSGGQDVPYRFYPREGRALFAFSLDGIRYQLPYPDETGISLPHSPRQWLLESNQTIRRRGALLKRFVQSLQEAAPVGAESNDSAPPQDGQHCVTGSFLPEASSPEEDPYKDDSQNMEPDLQTILTAALLTESKFSGEASLASGAAELASDGGSLQRTVAASLFAESMVAAGGTSSEGAEPRHQEFQDRRCEVSSALFAEYVLSVYEVPAQKKPSLMKIRFKIAAKKVEGRLQGWLHRHPRMYQTLTGLGVKRLYIVLKRRAAR